MSQPISDHVILTIANPFHLYIHYNYSDINKQYTQVLYTILYLKNSISAFAFKSEGKRIK